MINIKTQQSTDTIVPLAAAILLYGEKDKTVYASHHPVTITDTGAEIGPGTSLSASYLMTAARDLIPVKITDCFIEESVIAFRDGLIGWWRRPQVTRVWFNSVKLNETRNLAGKQKAYAVEIPLPGLVFFVCAGRFYVFAVKGSQRPTRSTDLYFAPLMNVWDTGQICTGNVKLPAERTSASTKGWEKAFLGSRFTHFNGTNTVNYEGGRLALTRDLVEGKFNAFPEKVLTACKLKLGAAVEQFSKHCAKGGEGNVFDA